MTKWEYKMLVYPETNPTHIISQESLEAKLNMMGAEGWELLSYGDCVLLSHSSGTGYHSSSAFTFKRPLA
jgi:hypothetical protein